MGKIIVPTIDLTAVANPAAGKYVLALDLDGGLKKKDSDGVITPIVVDGFIPTSGGVLDVDATLVSANVDDQLMGYLSLDYGGAGRVMLSADSGNYNDAQVYLEQGYVELSTYYSGLSGGGALFVATNNKGLYLTDSSFSFSPAILYSTDTHFQLLAGSTFGESAKGEILLGSIGTGFYEVVENAIVGAVGINADAGDGMNRASIRVMASPLTPGAPPKITMNLANGGFMAVTDGQFRLSGDTSRLSLSHGIEGYDDFLLSIQPNNRTLHGSDGTATVSYESPTAGLVYQADYSANYTDRSVVDKGFVDTRVNTIKVSLSAAQILTANSVPIEVVAAPGAGKIISVLSALCKFTYGTTQFDGGGLGNLILDTLTDPIMSTGVIGNSTSSFDVLSQAYGGTQFAPNLALLFKTDSDSTVGDSTIDLYITYSIITL